MRIDGDRGCRGMKALTIWQPWVSLIAAGKKQFGTRSWRPSPGQLAPGDLLAIHAAVRKPRWQEWSSAISTALCDFEGGGFVASVAEAAAEELPRGVVLAICRVDGFYMTEDVVARPACYMRPGTDAELELALGDFSPGRFAWALKVIEVLDPPIPAQGRQRLWDWEREEATP